MNFIKNRKINIIFFFLYLFFFFFSCSFFDRTPNYITISPQGEQIVIAGSSFKYYARVYSAGGYECSDIQIKYSCTEKAGNFKGSTFYAGEIPGIYKIIVKAEDFSEETTVRIISKDYLSQPFEYNGTVYQGRTTGENGSPITIDDNKGSLTINEPAIREFECDGFFRMRGIVNNPQASNYILMTVQKVTSSEMNWTWFGESLTSYCHYYLRNSFDTRIWLREGAGTYRIDIFMLFSVFDNPNIDGTKGPDGIIYEGDTNGYCCSSSSYTFFVTNTREEDGRWLYPSGFVQSDSIELMNAAIDLTYKLSTTKEKIEVINKFVVNHLTYDNDSLKDGYRKAQDALNTYRYKTGVCTGYSDLTAALFRSCGIPAKVIYGAFDSKKPYSTLHAWNNVSFDGGKTFKFMEPQQVNGFKDIPYDDSQEYLIEPKFLFESKETDEDGAAPRIIEDLDVMKELHIVTLLY